MTDEKEVKSIAQMVRQEGETKKHEANMSRVLGEAWIARELDRRAVALLAAASILDRIAFFGGNNARKKNQLVDANPMRAP